MSDSKFISKFRSWPSNKNPSTKGNQMTEDIPDGLLDEATSALNDATAEIERLREEIERLKKELGDDY